MQTQSSGLGQRIWRVLWNCDLRRLLQVRFNHLSSISLSLLTEESIDRIDFDFLFGNLDITWQISYLIPPLVVVFGDTDALTLLGVHRLLRLDL